MKPDTLKVLDESDEEFVELLIKQGMKPVVARTLTFLKNTESAKHRQIELGTRMSQQDVSRSLRELRNNKWVSSRSVKQERKRGYNLYSLIVDIDEIITGLETKMLADVARIEEDIAELKSLDLREVD